MIRSSIVASGKLPPTSLSLGKPLYRLAACHPSLATRAMGNRRYRATLSRRVLAHLAAGFLSRDICSVLFCMVGRQMLASPLPRNRLEVLPAPGRNLRPRRPWSDLLQWDLASPDLAQPQRWNDASDRGFLRTADSCRSWAGPKDTLHVWRC